MPKITEFMNTDAPSGKQLSLGIDNEGRLYVNGERVITEQKVSLVWWVNIVVVLGGARSICTRHGRNLLSLQVVQSGSAT